MIYKINMTTLIILVMMAPLEIIDILVSMTSLAPAGRSFNYTIRQQ